MDGNERRRKVKGSIASLDAMEVLIGIAIVIMAVMSFWSPNENWIFFPIIFVLAAIFHLIKGEYRRRHSRKKTAEWFFACFQLTVGGMLTVFALLSAISMR